jgi:hypothetical protein
MIATISVAAAMTTIHFLNVLSFSLLASLRREVSRPGEHRMQV